MKTILKPYSVFLDPYGFKKGPKTKQWNIFDISSGLPYNSVWAIAIEDSYNIWVGTYGGGLVMLWFDGIIWHIDNGYNSGLPDNFVTSIAIDGKNNKWIGTQFQYNTSIVGLAKLLYGGLLPSLVLGLPGNNIYSIVCDTLGYLWIGSNGSGLIRFNINSGNVNTFDYAHYPGLLNDHITSIFIDGSLLWIGTFGGGLAVFDYGNSSWPPTPSLNLPNKQVTSIVVDGNIKWIGTDWGGGLVKYDGANCTVFLAGQYITALAIEIAADGTHILWVGTRFSGLARFDGSSWSYITSTPGSLPDNFITSIAIDNATHNKWIGTYSGGLAIYNEISF